MVGVEVGSRFRARLSEVFLGAVQRECEARVAFESVSGGSAGGVSRKDRLAFEEWMEARGAVAMVMSLVRDWELLVVELLEKEAGK